MSPDTHACHLSDSIIDLDYVLKTLLICFCSRRGANQDKSLMGEYLVLL